MIMSHEVILFLFLFLFRRLIIVTFYNGTTSELLGQRPYDAYVLGGGMSSLLLVELFLDEGCLGRIPGWSCGFFR